MSCSKLFVGLALIMAGIVPALAQDEEAAAVAADAVVTEADADAADDEDLSFDREPSECLPLNRIRETEVIDDSTIVFYSSHNQLYVNNLPRRCPGLRNNDRFSYEVRQNRLCETDWITVLERYGVGFGRGFTCRLGVFHPANEETVDILKRAAETGLGRPASTATPVELPEDDADESDGSNDAAEPDGSAEQ